MFTCYKIVSYRMSHSSMISRHLAGLLWTAAMRKHKMRAALIILLLGKEVVHIHPFKPFYWSLKPLKRKRFTEVLKKMSNGIKSYYCLFHVVKVTRAHAFARTRTYKRARTQHTNPTLFMTWRLLFCHSFKIYEMAITFLSATEYILGCFRTLKRLGPGQIKVI